jgi:hypothetical protein
LLTVVPPGCSFFLTFCLTCVPTADTQFVVGGKGFDVLNGSIDAYMPLDLFEERLDEILFPQDEQRKLRDGGSKKGKGSSTDRVFWVANDDYDGTLEVVNGIIVDFFSAEDSDDATDIGLCTETVCESYLVKALIVGERAGDTDVLILNVGFTGNDEMEISCPGIFQNPTVEVLHCEADDPTDCTPEACVTANDVLCFDSFDFDQDDVLGNELRFDTDSPTGEWVRVQFKITCTDGFTGR